MLRRLTLSLLLAVVFEGVCVKGAQAAMQPGIVAG